MNRLIRDVMVIIGGFGQGNHAMHGMRTLHDGMIEIFPARTESVLEQEAWHVSPTKFADKIAAIIQRDGVTTPNEGTTFIGMAAYSWGNPTAIKICERLFDYGISVEYLAMIDPVPRLAAFWWWPSNIWALSRFGKLNVPPNVRHVETWRQVNNRPLGRRLCVCGETKIINEHVYGPAGTMLPSGAVLVANPNIGHNQMDDREEIHAAIKARVRELSHTGKGAE